MKRLINRFNSGSSLPSIKKALDDIVLIIKRIVTDLVLLLVVLMVAVSVAGVDAMDQGAAEMTMGGGERGEVWFPHQQHQKTLGDCNLCHDLFPQVSGSIEKQKVEGVLKQKQVMNKKCIACHRKMKKAGQASGPVSCKNCHKKE